MKNLLETEIKYILDEENDNINSIVRADSPVTALFLEIDFTYDKLVPATMFDPEEGDVLWIAREVVVAVEVHSKKVYIDKDTSGLLYNYVDWESVSAGVKKEYLNQLNLKGEQYAKNFHTYN